MAEGSEDPFPEGLVAHAELQLRRAYEHSAVERGRERPHAAHRADDRAVSTNF